MDEPTICPTCNAVLNVSDWPFCPHGRTGAGGVKDDSIPGGVWLENYGPTPVKVYSHTERKALMKKRGLSEFVRHMPIPGTDKSPHTTDWSKGSMDPYTMAAAEALVSRAGKATDAPEPDVAFRPFNVTGTKRDAVNILKLMEGRDA